MIEYLGLWILIAMTINMWALLSVLGSGAGLVAKAVWAFILLVPVLGFILWFFVGPRAKAV